MKLPLPVTNDNVNRALIEVLNPIMKLTFTEKDILNEYISLYKSLLDLEDYDIIATLASTNSRLYVRNKLKITEHAYNNHISKLRKKRVLVDGKLHPLITNNCTLKTIQLTYELYYV
jgi:hypothetical protein